MTRKPFELSKIREQVSQYYEGLQDRDGQTGAYRMAPGKRTDLYSSTDIALIRTIMGEDFSRSLTEQQRAEWVDHINSFGKSDGASGAYNDAHGHHALHANGMVIGALGPLGGKQVRPVQLYEALDSANKIESWLDQIDWSRQWHASHQFWGGMHCFSFSQRCTPEWREAVFDWLDRELDRDTGWWRRGIAHSDRHQPLGGSVHIIPIYQHHGRDFPCPERVIDSTLALQLPSGRWLQGGTTNAMHYLELDALYALKMMGDMVPHYRRSDIDQALDRYAALALAFWAENHQTVLQQHPHVVLSAVGTFGLLQQHRPDEFRDDSEWTDIFSDRRFYMTDAVEVLD